MTVKIVMTYEDGTDHGKSVTITETWEGNIIPLAKIYKAFDSINYLKGNRLEKTKVVRVLK